LKRLQLGKRHMDSSYYILLGMFEISIPKKEKSFKD
jgi:hypothetical protein